jgi:hypothetical protein
MNYFKDDDEEELLEDEGLGKDFGSLESQCSSICRF